MFPLEVYINIYIEFNARMMATQQQLNKTTATRYKMRKQEMRTTRITFAFNVRRL